MAIRRQILGSLLSRQTLVHPARSARSTAPVRAVAALRLLPRTMMTLGLVCAAPLAWSADATALEERMRLLESRLNRVERENEELRARLAVGSNLVPAPTFGFHGNGAPNGANRGAVVPSGTEARVAIGGFSQVQAEFGGIGDQRFAGGGDRLYARRSRLSVITSFEEHFEARIEAEFGANTIAPVSGLKAHTNEIYLNWSRFPFANLRLGQTKPAFCSEMIAIEYKGPMVERSLGADRIADARQIGASVFGELIPRQLSYAAMLANGNGTNTNFNDNRKFQLSAHVAATAFDTPQLGRLTLGAGFLRSHDGGIPRPGFNFDADAGGSIDNLFSGRRAGWGLDVAWRRGLLELSSELLRMQFDPHNRLPDPSFHGESWQLTAALFLVPHQFQVALRREHFDPNLTRRADSSESWLVGFNYYLKGDDLRIMVDYLLGRAPQMSDDRGRLITRFQIVY